MLWHKGWLWRWQLSQLLWPPQIPSGTWVEQTSLIVSSDVTHMICVPRGWSHQHPGICTRPLWPGAAVCTIFSMFLYLQHTVSMTQSRNHVLRTIITLSLTRLHKVIYSQWFCWWPCFQSHWIWTLHGSFFPPGQLFDGYDDEYQCPILDEDRVSELPHWTVEQRNTTMSEAEIIFN